MKMCEMPAAANAIIVDFGVQINAIFGIMTGEHVPQGRLPVTLPADMDTVETHCEDLTSDIRPYTDSEGHIYAAGFGM